MNKRLKLFLIPAIMPVLFSCGMTIVKSEDLSKLQSSNSNYMAENQSLKDDLAAQKDQAKALETENKNLSNLIDSTKGSLVKQIDLQQAANSNLTLENLNLQNEITLQKNQISSLQDSRDVLQKQLDSLNREITNLSNMVDSTKGNLGLQIDSLNSDIKKKDLAIGSLNSEISNKDNEIASLRQNIKDLSAERDKILTQKDLEVSNLALTSSNIISQMQDAINSGDLKIQQLGDELNIDFKDKIFFDLGSADIKNNGKKALNELVNVLKTVTNKQIRVEG